MTEHRIIQGDCLDVLRTLESESVHCVVTSPPYFGLRDYNTPGQIGLEATPAEFVAKMVEVFAEVHRVLRKDGTLWLNLGDSYAGSWSNYHPNSPAGKHGQRKKDTERFERPGYASQEFLPPTANVKALGMKPKDLMGMPWRVAFALQEWGWWLRQDIIWNKPNPMPESVTDRCTKSHEYIFLLTKSAKYFYDAEAVKESATFAGKEISLGEKSLSKGQANGRGIVASGNGTAEFVTVAEGRNKRSVWTVTTHPFPEAHFATFPPKLIEPCILAGTSEKGCCVDCGAPWERVTEKIGEREAGCYSTQGGKKRADAPGSVVSAASVFRTGMLAVRETSGWQKTCKCTTEETKPCTVLDPFAGAGTTLLVSKRHGRNSIGIELNPEYIKLIERRLEHYYKPAPPRVNEETELPLFEI